MSEGAPLPDGWAWSTLGEVSENLDRFRKPISADERAKRPGDVPYYGASGQVGTIDSHLFNEDLLLLGEDGVQFFDRSKSKAYRVKGPAWVNNHAHVLKASSSTSNAYLCHYLNFFNYEGYANGTTRLKLTKSAAESIPIPIPPLSEQQRIVEALEDHLSRLDIAEAGLKTAKARLTGLVERTISNSVQLAGAELRPLSHFLRDKPRNGRSVPTTEVGFPVLRLTALRGDSVDMLEHKIGDWDRQQAAPYLVRESDVLLSRGNGSLHLVGRAALVREPPPEIAFPDTMVRIPLNLDIVDANFFVQVWNSREIRRQIETLARTTAGIHKVNQSILQSIKYPDIPIDVQRRIAADISTSDIQNRYVQAAVLQALRRSGSLRSRLLESAFSGTLVDQDQNDEPASALLERIAAERARYTPASRRRTPAKTSAKV